METSADQEFDVVNMRSEGDETIEHMSADATEALGNRSDIEPGPQPTDPKAIEMSEHFIGRWTQLISTTNWEKGKIISQWREALQDSGASSVHFSDEAWCRCVGGLTPQHVGRLRRVYDRFANVFTTYPGIYWSHFLAALDWDDAEMWLEGASQSRWSVSQMRRTRWEAMGGDPNQEPRESDVTMTTEDEDFTPLAEADGSASTSDAPRSIAEGPRPEDPDFGDEDSVAGADFDGADDLPWDEAEPTSSPFAALPSLPVDLAEALEQFKLGIIRHRASGWAEVSQADVIKALDALKAFCQ